MKLVTLASGSKGNCIYIESTESKIIVDAGISVAKITNNLKTIGVKSEDIDAIVLTHEHSDHIKSVGHFALKYNCKIYIHRKLYDIVQKKLNIGLLNSKISFFDDVFYIKDLLIEPFEVPHDSDMCCAFNFYNQEKKISIVTDLGHFNDNIVEMLRESSLVVLESNYDDDLILANYKYPEYLKSRIRGELGHLSNINAAELIYRLVGKGTKQVILSHLSEDNNNPKLAYTAVKDYLKGKGVIEGEHIFVDVAPVCLPGNIYNLK